MLSEYAEEWMRGWRVVTAPARRMPSVVIAGAPCCGADELARALDEQGDFAVSRGLEPLAVTKYPGSRARIAMSFPLRGASRKPCIEVAPELFAHPGAPAAAKTMLPDVRWVFLLRNPTERTWVEYSRFRDAGLESASFSERIETTTSWLRRPDCDPLLDAAAVHRVNPARFLWNSLYVRHLARWIDAVGRTRCWIGSLESDAESLATFLGIDRIGPIALPKDSAMPESARRQLDEIFAEDQAQLSRMKTEAAK